MDNLTHGLTGALMGQMGLKKKTGLGLAALVLGANLPDIDVVGLLWLDGTEALGFRRGITHGPIGVVLLPIGLAALLWGFDRWQDGRGKRPAGRDPVSFKWLYILGLIGAISHSLMDWLNVYGVRFLYPFDKSWYYGDTLFIIDVWLWAILALGVWWSARAEKRGGAWKQTATATMCIAVAYTGASWALTQVAKQNALTLVEYTFQLEPMEVVASPVPFLPINREILFRYSASEELGGGVVFGAGDYTPSEGTLLFTPHDRYTGRERLSLDTPQDPSRWEQLSRYSGFDEEAAYAVGTKSSQVEAFFVWSRMPEIYAVPDDEGNLSFKVFDQRFKDPRAVSRFSIWFDKNGDLMELPAP
ncbi:MAG: metal-dependent hydrolase [Pseudomonadota bacterium]